MGFNVAMKWCLNQIVSAQFDVFLSAAARMSNVINILLEIVESVLPCATSAWYTSCREEDKMALQRVVVVVRAAEKITSQRLPSVQDVFLKNAAKTGP